MTHLRKAVWGLFLVALVLTATATSHAGSETWMGEYNVQYNHGTGQMQLKEEPIGAGPAGLVGRLILTKKRATEKVICDLMGPASTDVRSDRVLLRGQCKKGEQDRWYYLYLAKSPTGFHGYYTAHGSPPTTGGLINVPETDFNDLGFVTAIWGAGGPQPTEPATGAPACPYYYVYDPQARSFVKQGEILRDLLGKEMEAMQREPISWSLVENGKLVISISEEKDEVAYIDYLALRVGDTVISANGPGSALALVAARDGSYLTMDTGEELTLEFDLSGSQEGIPIQLLSAGYYTH